MGKIVLYYCIWGPPSRAVLLTGKTLDIEFELKVVDPLKGDHLTTEFKQLNPQHTVPLIDDNGTIVYDSHAICAYLVDKYAKNDKLYPKDLSKRAEVNARLHFDCGFLFARMRFLYEPILYYGCTEKPLDKVQYIEKCWPIMEAFLEKGKYLCGNEMTIADFCCIATISSMGHNVNIDAGKYSKLSGWISRMTEVPHYKSIVADGGDLLVRTIDELLTCTQFHDFEKLFNGNLARSPLLRSSKVILTGLSTRKKTPTEKTLLKFLLGRSNK